MKTLRIITIATLFTFSLASINAQSLTKGNLVCIHNMSVVLKKDVTATQFENFMLNNYIPAFEKNVKGVKVYLVKGERGEYTGEYAVFMQFKNEKAWKEFSPQEGELSEMAKACLKKMMPLESELYKIAQTDFTTTQWLVL